MLVAADAVFSQAMFHVMEIMPTDPGNLAFLHWETFTCVKSFDCQGAAGSSACFGLLCMHCDVISPR